MKVCLSQKRKVCIKGLRIINLLPQSAPPHGGIAFGFDHTCAILGARNLNTVFYGMLV
jgi:aspartyl-tRNA synthetase